jgi:hypothetical protein
MTGRGQLREQIAVSGRFSDSRERFNLEERKLQRFQPPHDFRRTTFRNLERARVPRSVAIELTGDLWSKCLFSDA